MAVRILDLQLIYGVDGARNQFERLCAKLIRSKFPDAKGIRVHKGDGGVDAYVGNWAKSAGVHVFQVKFFPIGLGKDQKSQVRDSFKTCLANRRFTTTQWTLCLPVDLSQDETLWFNNWKQEVSTSTLTSDNIVCWGETEFEELLYKPENRGIKEAFFEERPPRSRFLQLDRTPHTFQLWPSFKEDFRFFGAFTPEGYNLLDEVQHFITAYNQAFEEARVLTCDKLTPYIAQGIEAEAKRPDFQEWQAKRQEALNVPIPNYWFERIASEITTTSAYGTLLGEGWSASWILVKPRTLGWLLAKRTDQAAQYIYEEFIREMGATSLVSLTWITDIFQAVWPELKSHPAYHKVWDAQECLYSHLYEAEMKLLNVLQIIQERYEGGIPLI